MNVSAKHPSVYAVRRLTHPIVPDATWNRGPWSGIDPLAVEHYMGERPKHIPSTQAKVAWDSESLYVIFRVEDRYVRAVAAGLHGPVWEDSCVEFFFTPGTDLSHGYFNLEMNCGGVMLLRHQVVPRQNPIALTAGECACVRIAHSLPERVEPEIAGPVVWSVEYRLPIAILDRYAPVTPPAPGVKWRANLYKCADKSSHPHWLTWAPVNRPQPDFHVPECFGTLLFE